MSYTLELNDRQAEMISALAHCIANETYEHIKPLTEEVFSDVMDLGQQITSQHSYDWMLMGSTVEEKDASEQAHKMLMKAKRSLSVPLFMDESIICNVPRSWIAWDELKNEGDL